MLRVSIAWILGTISPAQTIGYIEAHGPGRPLWATMVPPAKDAPIILMIPGSGSTDRDDTSPLGVRTATYRLLAEGLAGQVIGSVRIDKPGMLGRQDAVPDATAVTITDYDRDTSTWVGGIWARTGAKCIWLLGHSEGGLVALAAAAG